MESLLIVLLIVQWDSSLILLSIFISLKHVDNLPLHKSDSQCAAFYRVINA